MRVLLFAILACAPGEPSAPSTSTPPARAQDAKPEAPADELARLRDELQRAQAAWTARDASGKPLPRDKELHPARLLVPRFELLAVRAAKTPVALEALVEVVRLASQGAAERVDDMEAARDRALEKLLADHVNDAGLARFADTLGEGSASVVGLERSVAFLQRARAITGNAEVRASATLAIALAWLEALDALPETRFAEAKELLRSVIKDFPGTRQARAAEPVLYAWEALRIQAIAPEVESIDADGKAFKLSDYRGRVVVIDFFGAWCAASRARLPAEKRWVEAYASRPFALIGVCSDEDRDDARKLGDEERAWIDTIGRPRPDVLATLPEKQRAFFERLRANDVAHARAVAKELGITWRVAADGSTKGPWAWRWNVTGWPTTYVIDASGRIRYRDLPDDELEQAIASLVREAEAAAKK